MKADDVDAVAELMRTYSAQKKQLMEELQRLGYTLDELAGKTLSQLVELKAGTHDQ